MPIPVLIGLGLGVAAGVTGVVKAVDAKQKNNQAQNVNEKARKIYDEAKADADRARRTANESVTLLGKERADTLTNECSDFRETFNKIHHIEDSFPVDFGGQLEWNEEAYVEMKNWKPLHFL